LLLQLPVINTNCRWFCVGGFSLQLQVICDPPYQPTST